MKVNTPENLNSDKKRDGLKLSWEAPKLSKLGMKCTQ